MTKHLSELLQKNAVWREYRLIANASFYLSADEKWKTALLDDLR